MDSINSNYRVKGQTIQANRVQFAEFSCTILYLCLSTSLAAPIDGLSTYNWE
jgi:hypothetical protein